MECFRKSSTLLPTFRSWAIRAARKTESARRQSQPVSSLIPTDFAVIAMEHSSFGNVSRNIFFLMVVRSCSFCSGVETVEFCVGCRVLSASPFSTERDATCGDAFFPLPFVLFLLAIGWFSPIVHACRSPRQSAGLPRVRALPLFPASFPPLPLPRASLTSPRVPPPSAYTVRQWVRVRFSSRAMRGWAYQ